MPDSRSKPRLSEAPPAKAAANRLSAGAVLAAGASFAALLAVLAGCGGGGSKTATPAVLSTSLAKATAYQINPSHSGYISFGVPLQLSSKPAWSVSLTTGGSVGAAFTTSAPLIAGGKVYVIAESATGASLYALNKATGQNAWGPIALSSQDATTGVSYDNGKLFVLNEAGFLQSFDATTGAAGWTAQLPGANYAFASPPAAANGIVYVGGESLFAIDEGTGQTIRSQQTYGSGTCSPAVELDSSGATQAIFVSYPCHVFGFDSTLATATWNYAGTCSGGGGNTDAVANGQLYVRDIGDVIYSASDGTVAGAFNGTMIPAIGPTRGYFLSSGTLQGVDLASRQAAWSFTGDGNLVTAPIAVDQTVFIASTAGTVFAVDAATGKQLWTGSAGGSISEPSLTFDVPVSGLAAGEGYLVVPAGATLTAWHIAGK